jgi:4-amino-4-deoxy-L-arabinose transferase-like glycosyltransferase
MTVEHPSSRFVLWLLAGTALTVALSLATRSLVPMDETRYVAVAWHMWERGDLVLPWLAGAPYSHKPPLLFWLVHAGWAVFGVNEWWPRLLSPIASLVAVALTWRLARRLWPDDAGVGERAGVVLAGTLMWVLFSSATMFDVLLTVFALAGVHGLLSAARGHASTGWGLVGLAIGGGLLTKGPVILLHLLPAAALVRLWTPVPPPSGRWLPGMLAAVGLGAVIALAWAVPAGLRGGAAYRDLILWGQTGGRLVHAFDHARPWWWYLPWLPAAAFPWLLWPRAWRALRVLAAGPRDAGVRLAVTWAGTVSVVLCVVSGKQLHYLLPILPAGALLLARGLGRGVAARAQDAWPVGLTLVTLAAATLSAGQWAERVGGAAWLADLPAWVAGAVLAAALLPWAARRSGVDRAPPWHVATAAWLTVAVVQAGVADAAGLAYDARPVGQRLGDLQRAGVPLALVGMADEGTFDFHGRLRRPLQEVRVPALGAWFIDHPRGVAVWRVGPDRVDDARPALHRQPWRGQYLVMVDAAQWRAWAAPAQPRARKGRRPGGTGVRRRRVVAGRSGRRRSPATAGGRRRRSPPPCRPGRRRPRPPGSAPASGPPAAARPAGRATAPRRRRRPSPRSRWRRTRGPGCRRTGGSAATGAGRRRSPSRRWPAARPARRCGAAPRRRPDRRTGPSAPPPARGR